MIKKIVFVCLLVLIGVMAGQGVFAQEKPPTTFFGGGIPTGPTSGKEFVVLLDILVDWVFVFVMVGATIFIILAGFQFISAGGDTNAVAEARRKLLYGAIGIAVAVMAKGLPVAVRSIIGT